MKKLFLLSLISINAFAGNLYSIKTLTYDSTRTYKSGDVIFCSTVDSDHNLVSYCVPLKVLEKSTFETNSSGEIVLNDNLKIGTTTNKTYLLDDMDAGIVSEIAIDEASKFDIEMLTKKGIRLNKDLGCHAPFECDWNIVIPNEKLFLQIKLNDRVIDRARLK